MKILVFTKDRPLQFQAYLESLLYFVYPIEDMADIIVVLPNKKNYEDLIKQYPLSWRFEENHGGFRNTLVEIFSRIKDEELILPGCDDCIWFRNANLNHARILNHVDTFLTFSYRLGPNIEGFNPSWNLAKNAPYNVIDWRGKPSHMGYPWELMASVYKASLFKELINATPQIRIPNDLEGNGGQIFFKNINNLADRYPYICFSKDSSCLAAADINRCQDIYENKIEGGVNETVESLLQKYKEGYRLNWIKYAGITPKNCFVGMENFELIKKKE